MKKIEFSNDTSIEFEPFDVEEIRKISCTLPPIKPSGYTASGYLYISPEDLAVQQSARPGQGLKPEDMNKVRVGILRSQTSHPFPRGLYVPFKFQRYGDGMHQLDSAYGPYQIDEKVKNTVPAGYY